MRVSFGVKVAAGWLGVAEAVAENAVAEMVASSGASSWAAYRTFSAACAML